MSARGENAQHSVVLCGDNAKAELSWHAITDTGLRREANQDSYVVAPPMFAVADGMGGHEGGEIASEAVTEQLELLAAETAAANLPFTVPLIISALEKAVDEIRERAGAAWFSAGTTVTGAFIDTAAAEPSWTVFNIGDSRVYQFFEGTLTQVTSDHSVVQHLIDTGAITPEEAEIHPHSNIITRAVGGSDQLVPDALNLAMLPGQRLLLCSDGLTKELTDAGIQYFMARAETAAEAAEMLVTNALENTGRDNISVIVIDVHYVSINGQSLEDATSD